ncbi:MAG TPA: dihydrolipoamide acetyltransferase, partial [Myxococcota bacterium]|nr:dihydrolipoamide acetyltransferase [Myxococcota bacterium]
MVYRGDSSVFAYLKDYLFKLRASYTFYATKGKITTVRAIGFQKGDITYDLRERPSITFDVKQVSYTSDVNAPVTPGAPATAPEGATEGSPK